MALQTYLRPLEEMNMFYISAAWIFLGNLMEYFVSVNQANKTLSNKDVLEVIHSPAV